MTDRTPFIKPETLEEIDKIRKSFRGLEQELADSRERTSFIKAVIGCYGYGRESKKVLTKAGYGYLFELKNF